MKKQHIVILVAVLIGLSLAVAFTVSGANSITGNGSPTVISYQGKVSQNGTPYNGTGYFKFAIVDAAAAQSFWSNDGTSSAGSEPTNGVDPVSRRDFWQLLYQLLKEKVTILFSTCYLDEAERCNRVGLIHKGRLLRCDVPANIKKQTRCESMEQAFVSIINDYESQSK